MVDIDVSELKQYIEGTIDFEGQKEATKLIDKSLLLGGIVSMALTLITGRFTVFVAGLASAYVISLGMAYPWPMYRKHPVNWASTPVITTKQ